MTIPLTDPFLIFWFQSGGIYDYKSHQTDPGKSPNELFGTPIGDLHADQFGNYLAGYAGGYAFAKTGDYDFINGVFTGGTYYEGQNDWNSGHPVSVTEAVSAYIGMASMVENGLIEGISDAIFPDGF